MTPARYLLIAIGASALVGATAAHAEPAKPSAGVTADGFAAQSINGSAPKSSLEWDAKRGRWGLKLDMEQHVVGDMQWRDVRPGVFYRVTPRLHIGGALSIAPDQPVLGPVDPQPPAPRVRLETTFKF
ncbi:MAG TPA: hypothetical protein VFC47_09445 [Caulobacteraceae bacterium]|nr:hypothetical protein [Caulobacteraceae bacterium]